MFLYHKDPTIKRFYLLHPKDEGAYANSYNWYELLETMALKTFYILQLIHSFNWFLVYCSEFQKCTNKKCKKERKPAIISNKFCEDSLRNVYKFSCNPIKEGDLHFTSLV